jgi:hypothetical protein
MLTLGDATISTNSVRGGDGGNGGGTVGGGSGGAGLGGGLYARDGMLTLGDATISTNSVRGGDGGDGGSFLLFAPGGNGGNGGAAFGGGASVNAATLQATNGTVAFNTAQDSQGGAGGRGSPPGNPGTGQAGQGGGVANAGGTVNALNTLVGDNAAASAPDFAGVVASLGHNLIGNSSGGSGYTATDLLDVDPVLGPLQNHGGPTLTHALLAGSPALNAGDPNQLGVADQRGVVRTGGVNIGAYQASATAFVLGAPGTVQAGAPFDVTVTAVDPYNQVAVGYTGTVTFATSDPDPGVVLPAAYTFTLADGGAHTFPGATTLITPGGQMLTVTDTTDGTITGSAIITVGSTAPGMGSDGLDRPARASGRAAGRNRLQN